MSELKATPGPWSWRTSNSWRRLGSDATGLDSDVLYPCIDRCDGHPNLEFPNGGFEGPDAHLLAASWDLYHALDAIVPPMCPLVTHHQPDCVWCTAMKALAKARGEQ